ncbi:MAG: tetratricopeptide repeat protein [Saprospiraceae bacterium]|nr:tetratricopeptide repeat protein [Saprospiraceae bacterium]
MKGVLAVFLSLLFVLISTVAIEAQESASDWYNKGLSIHVPALRLEYFTQAISIKSDYADAYRARAAVKSDLGEFIEAIYDYDQSLKFEEHAEAYYNRATCKFLLGQYDAAILDFDHAIRLKPTHAYALSAKGCALLLQSKPEDALELLNKALQLDAGLQSAINCKIEAMKQVNQGRNMHRIVSQPIIVSNVKDNKSKPINVKPARQDNTVAEMNHANATNTYQLTDETSLREGPDHTTRVLLRFAPGNQVNVLEKTNKSWWKVQYKSKTGYAKAAMLKAVQ